MGTTIRSRKKIISAICCVLVVLMLSTTLLFGCNRKKGAEWTHKDIIVDIENAKKYIQQQRKYKGKNIVSIEKGRSKFLYVKCVDQCTCTYNYNKSYKTAFDGACAETAVTGLVVSCAKNDEPDLQSAFNMILNEAIKREYYSYTLGKGTHRFHDGKHCVKELVDFGLNQYPSSKNKYETKVVGDDIDMYEVICKFTDMGRLSIFQVTNHNMVVAGYYEFEVTYIQKKCFLGCLYYGESEYKTVTEQFLLVDSGIRVELRNGEVICNKDPIYCDERDIGVGKAYKLYPADKMNGTMAVLLDDALSM